MTPVSIVAIEAESALGSGVRAYSVGEVGERPVSAIHEDAILEAAGLERPFLARAVHEPKGEDPAAVLLRRVGGALGRALRERVPELERRRIALVVGTSSGGMASLVAALDARARGGALSPELAAAAPYFGPLRALEDALGVRFEERVQILAACASSAVALGYASRLLALGHVDLAIAGGYDAVTPFVATGFESLGATSASMPRPFRVGRDGMALGEAAAFFVLALPASGLPELGRLAGFAASSDAVHVTAPDREGGGLSRAAVAALADAGIRPEDVDVVSAHATATPFNDAAEARALATALGPHAADVVVHPFKSVVGHTLGASAALEIAAVLEAMRRGISPGACSPGMPDPEAPARLLERNESGRPTTALKLSAAFGGANAALVVTTGSAPGTPVARGAARIVRVGTPRSAEDARALRGVTRLPDVQLERLDRLSAAAVAAVATVLDGVLVTTPDRTGVILGSAAACLENNEAFQAGLRARGRPGAAPRRFPATSPNLAPGQCSIAFGLRGPSFAVGAGPAAAVEALLVAVDLLEAGDADALVVVAAEDVGPVVTDVFVAAGLPLPVSGAVAVLLERAPGGSGIPRDVISRALREASRSENPRGDPPGYPSLIGLIQRLSPGNHPS
ncbi:MAG TPA: beta-ketoacyl synthase N-terminal-like domain-containing protein [Polyangiaceae bacterium]|nr:beta-ketoacyl synthase N-terminal-like domain-containing protein [Polyangiaceae bacterium]